jgi:hypothetical protein
VLYLPQRAAKTESNPRNTENPPRIHSPTNDDKSSCHLFNDDFHALMLNELVSIASHLSGQSKTVEGIGVFEGARNERILLKPGKDSA